jgi:hypothetical protein
MDTTDTQAFRYTVVLVTKNVVQADRLRRSVEETLLLNQQFDFLWLEMLADIDAVELSSVCAVLIDQALLDDGTSEFDSYSEIERIRTLHQNCNIAFFTLANVYSQFEQLMHVARTGVDGVILDLGADHILANTYGALRLLRSVADRRRSKFKREDIAPAIGPWIFVPRLRSIKLPDGSRKKLTDTEWGYLMHLYNRDVKKLDVAENIRIKYEEEINQKAVVYKIKKKLGSSFPIITEIGGRYILVAPD